MNSDWEDSQANETGWPGKTQEWYFRWFVSKLINLLITFPSVHAKPDLRIILHLVYITALFGAGALC